MPDAPDIPPPDADLLDRYFAGTASSADREAIGRWVVANPGRQALLASLRVSAGRGVDIGQHEPVIPHPLDVDAGWHAARARVGLDRGAHRPRRRPNSVSSGIRGRWPSTGIAAAMCMMLIVGFAAGSVRHRARRAVPGREYATGRGQRLTMTLVDGTRFTLAPASRLRLDPAYGYTRRDVTLDGEAFFAVTHDARRPFAVNAHNAVVTDIGTQFDVRGYATDSSVRVAVAEGQVAVAPARRAGPASAHPAVSLSARDVAIVSAAGAALVSHGIDPSTYTAWAAGRLAFDDTPLVDVVADLARRYGVEIRLADVSLATRHIRAAFPEESVDALFAQLAPAVGARAERRDGVITLYAVRPAGRP